jgi:DNA-binding response OmpR family regulator
MLRRDYQTRAVPIVVVATSEASTAELGRAYESGADLMLVKPVTPENLIPQIRVLIERAADVTACSKALRARAEAELTNSRQTRRRERPALQNKALARFTTKAASAAAAAVALSSLRRTTSVRSQPYRWRE